MDTVRWKRELLAAERKKATPVLSFPSVQLLGVSVCELITKSALQAEGMVRIAERCDAGAALSMMDLSVEAEAFGSAVRFSDTEIPTVIGHIAETPEDAERLRIPAVGAGRTGLCVEAVGMAKARISDRPVLAGVTGPFSLAARLTGVSEALYLCYDEPEMVELLLEKATEFSVAYIRAFRDAGADGVMMAEPAAGLLSPELMGQFSTPYVRRIIEAVQDEHFALIYHNCGGSVLRSIEQLKSLGAFAYHFGNSVSMKTMLELMPQDALLMGNLDPSALFCHGTPERMHQAMRELMDSCASHPNFIPSSGCDIPYQSPWENIDAFFRAVEEYRPQTFQKGAASL